jgi:hypothetical protein
MNMRTLNSISTLILILLTALFASCEDDMAVRDPSPETNPNSSNVYFLNTNDTIPILAIDQTSFDVVLGREKTEKDQVVALAVESVYTGLFEVPESVEFKAGEDEKTVNIKIKELELMKKHHIAISIEHDQTVPYLIQENYPRLELYVLQEDFAPYANGTYTSEFFEESWEIVLEYSPATELYRFKDCWVEGYDVLFKWDKETNEVLIQGAPNSSGSHIHLQTGYMNGNYGMISAYYDQSDLKYYDEESKTFTFPITWMVSAGSFGSYPDSYAIEEILQ